ncbi:uncharacterized protein EAE97_004339 [Botrytis byssoidea]|uniref:Uncharacterized protein n=1 Tax=Botrytis byssoidea TaxID=139641 RepID=A0A9P5M6I6_9HELO|nr:uncharacterized protein EAE97_004339 [Botrytis byssoidea]KAF7947090.1 hypothetical protein EAE97_004339 [Botrytis byssoidea]
MSETNGSIPVNNPDNSIRSPRAVWSLRFNRYNPLIEVDAFDVAHPSSPPPPYSLTPPLDAPAPPLEIPDPPPYIICSCSSHEHRKTLLDLGFHSEISHEIWNKWQLHKSQHPEVYQNPNPRLLLYYFLSFAFQATQLSSAFPGYDPRQFNAGIGAYLFRWEIPYTEYFTREWDEAQRIERFADAAAQWTVLTVTMHCLGHPPPRYVWTEVDNRRFIDLWCMARAVRSVL